MNDIDLDFPRRFVLTIFNKQGEMGAARIHNARSVREALRGFFPAENLPTSTWIGVSALASKDFLIEIEAVAVLE